MRGLSAVAIGWMFILGMGAPTAWSNPVCDADGVVRTERELRQEMLARAKPAVRPKYRTAIEDVRNPRTEERTLDQRAAEAGEEVLFDYQRVGRDPPPVNPMSLGKRVEGVERKQKRKLVGGIEEKGFFRKEKVWVDGKWQTYAKSNVEVRHGTAQTPVEMGNVVDDYGVIKAGIVSVPPKKVLIPVGKGKVQKIFRPLYGDEVNMVSEFNLTSARITRKTMAASKLNAKLKLHTVPRSQIAEINGKVGILSDFAPGHQMGEGYAKEFLDEISRSENKAFEFLIGQSDAHPMNFHAISKDRAPPFRVMVFDHDKAFQLGLPFRHRFYKHPFGHDLPDKYTREFVSELEKMTPERLKETLGPYLTDLELEGVMFRRDVILKDVRMRQAKGERVYLD